MSRIPKKCKTRRLNLEMPQSARDRLEKLRDDTEADSLAEVVRRALAVYEYLCKVKNSGGIVQVEQGGRTTSIEFL